MAVTIRAPSSTARASHGRGSSLTLAKKTVYRIKAFQSGSVTIGATPVLLKGAMDIIAEARDNKKKVIEGAASVEYGVARIILKHFYPADSDRSKEFDLMVLRSDWCSFAAKRKLVHWIIDSRRILEGIEKQKYEKLLRDTMSHRNAFAHGELSSDGAAAFLSYFEGSPKKQELTDDYWKKVEATLAEAFHMTDEVSVRSGATKRAAPVSEEGANT